MFYSLFNIGEPYSLVTVLVLVIGILHYFLPTETINEFLFNIVSKDEVLEYESASLQFDEV